MVIQTAGQDAAKGLRSSVRGSNQSGLRAHNERLVLSLLRRQGPMAKAEIARASGLSAQTISVIMRGLEEEGLLVRGEPVRGKVGQPSVPMHLAADGACFFGLKVGRRSADVILINFVGEVLGRVHRTYPYPSPDGVLEFATTAIEELTKSIPRASANRIAGLGIAMPFRLWDWGVSIGAESAEMDQWRHRDIAAELAQTISYPVLLQNDASAACASELVFGKTDLPENFLHFYVGYFIGGGLVLNNRLHTGPTGNAGAVGPLPIPVEDGRPRPLLEIASLSVLEDQLVQQGHPTRSLWVDPEDWDVNADTEDQWIRKAAFGLCFATVAACSVFDFEAILIDGWLPVRVRRKLVAETRAALSNFDLTGVEIPDIKEGSIGPDARSLGAASLPLSERYLVDQSALYVSG